MIRRRAECCQSGRGRPPDLSPCLLWQEKRRAGVDFQWCRWWMVRMRRRGPGGPFGVRVLLPDGVYVIGTYRTGLSLARPDVPFLTVRVSKDDRRNVGDIREFLARAVAEGTLASRVAVAGIDPREFASVLAERCEGVWVYLRYALDEVRLGLRGPAAISDLPSGLRNYYDDQIRRWRLDPAWGMVMLPLVATLGVAGEPLPGDVLARLAGNLDPQTVRRWCDYTLRPLLTTTQPTPGMPLRYEIYHASFREMLNATDDYGLASGSKQPYDQVALADELHGAAAAAHARIANTYLGYFGGLDAGLPVLSRDPEAADVDHGYPLRHLAYHLSHAGKQADLHRLLAADGLGSGDRRVNVWFTAHEHADCIISYLDDLARARNHSASESQLAVSRNWPAPTLGTEIRYALMAASISSQTVSISAALLEQLIQIGMWSPARGLDHGRRLSHPASRADALIAVYRFLDGRQRKAVIAEALAATTAIADDWARGDALTRLLPDLQPELLPDALATAAAMADGFPRCNALKSLAPHLPPELLSAAVAAAAKTERFYRPEVLSSLAPFLPPGLLAEALAAATAINVHYSRADALSGLAPYLPPRLLAEALAAASAITDSSSRVRALTGLVPHLPADQQAPVLASTLATIPTIESRYRAHPLTRLAPYLSPRSLAKALAVAMAINNSYSRAEALSGLARYLPPGLLAEALAAAAAITDSSSRARALTGLLPHFPAGQQAPVLKDALAAAAAITDSFSCVRALTGLLPHVPAGQQAPVLKDALAAAASITSSYSDGRALTGLLPYLPTGQQTAVAASVLATATAAYGASGGVALADLAPYLPQHLLGDALAAASKMDGAIARGTALAALAPHLPPPLMEKAMVIAAGMAESRFRTEILTSLASQLSPQSLAEAVAAAAAVYDGPGRTS